MEAKEQDLWLRVSAFRDQQAISDLLKMYRNFAASVAVDTAKSLPRHISLYDLIDFAVSGLGDAIMRFDPNLGIKFTTFARRRCVGNIQDELRKLMWFGRSKGNVPRMLSLERFYSRPAPTVQLSLDDDIILRSVTLQSIEFSRLELAKKLDAIPKIVICSHEACKKPAVSQGLCESHFREKNKVIRRNKHCSHDGCTKRVFTAGKCRTHYYQPYSSCVPLISSSVNCQT